MSEARSWFWITVFCIRVTVRTTKKIVRYCRKK